jgi:ppGpp synthetase/RelA/SpoT-type nucleotidyltranferase
MENDHEKIKDEYNKNIDIYKAFTNKIEGLIKELASNSALGDNSIEISSRTKTLKSLNDKITRKVNKYNNLNEITDISGIRIVCLFSDQIEIIKNIIEKNFEKISDKCENKIDSLEPDRFGYLSLHYVIKLPKCRIDLSEYNKYDGMMCEIQVRSMLQHVWAEIEHDFGYKAERQIPYELIRRFSRLAGLLEIADEEFVKIKNDTIVYRNSVEEKLKNNSNDIYIDSVSLEAYVSQSKTIEEIDKNIESKTNIKCEGNYIRSDFDLVMLQFFNIKTLRDLESKLVFHKNDIIKFAEIFNLDKKEKRTFSKAISLFYLGYVSAIKENKILEYVNGMKFTDDARASLSEELVEISKKI